MDAPLDVFLNGTRGYVQGTQIVARAAEAVLGGGQGTLRQAAFHNITDHLVALVPATAETPLIGRAVFEDAQGTPHSAGWRTLETVAPRRDGALHSRWTRLETPADHPLSARFSVSDLNSAEDYLNVLIQTIKGLHAGLAEDVEDIWFTGLRRATIPLPDFPETAGQLDISFDRMMGRNGEFQSIQRTRFEGAAGTTVDAVVTFAFKSEVYSHAT